MTKNMSIQTESSWVLLVLRDIYRTIMYVLVSYKPVMYEPVLERYKPVR